MNQNDLDKDLQAAAGQVSSETYEPSDYESEQFASQGLATTHEQVSDAYMEGTNDGKIDEYDGEKNVQIPRENYNNMFTR